MTDLAGWIEDAIKSYGATSAENSLGNAAHERAWGEPLVAFSNGDDSLYQKLKADIGAFYFTPAEAFQRAFPGHQVKPQQLTVISWILPQTDATRSDHRKENRYPSERWARSRYFGEAFNASLRRHVANVLNHAGFQALAPVDASFWSKAVSERYGFSSNWSERHAAHVSGLGTFGLCDGLITAAGKAVRCGSVVARIAIEPTTRPYADHHAYCLHFTHGKCGKCMGRCPAGAISEAGHDKTKCWDYLQRVTFEYVKNQFGIETYACGLCQTRVPCESRIPTSPTMG